VDIVSVIDLPEPFRLDDFQAFHGRDAARLSEQVEPGRISKGLLWQGHPACLTLRFTGRQAQAELLVDGPADAEAGAALTVLARRMLGLTQPVERFEAAYGAHPEVGRLIARHPGLRLPVAASPFEALTWAITGQQISVHAAVSLRRRLIQAVGVHHSGGLLCYPDAAAVLALSADDLGHAGFSRAKARTLLEVSRRVERGELPLERWLEASAPTEAAERLLDTPGIGPWTVSYALLRGFGWLDGSLHGDVAVRRGLQSLLAAPDKLDANAAERWLAPFSPWRALVAAHLWAWNATVA
jgi:DNA-3-methyladenine glycosylase II